MTTYLSSIFHVTKHNVACCHLLWLLPFLLPSIPHIGQPKLVEFLFISNVRETFLRVDLRAPRRFIPHFDCSVWSLQRLGDLLQQVEKRIQRRDRYVARCKSIEDADRQFVLPDR